MKKEPSPLDPRLQQEISDRLFAFAESGMQHNSYSQELREQTSIEKGDLSSLSASLSEEIIGTIGVLSPDELRNQKNLGIVTITLAARSAIRGGLSPEISFSMSDTYINEIERQTDIGTLWEFVHACEFQYCRMVHELRRPYRFMDRNESKKNPHIEKCKDFIITHLHDKLTLQSLANELHLNANYLSDLVRTEEGIALSDYILQEKLKRVINLLNYSEYTYSEIAAYLGFSSQSHLGTRFKQYTGYTLRQYRSKYQFRNNK